MVKRYRMIVNIFSWDISAAIHVSDVAVSHAKNISSVRIATVLVQGREAQGVHRQGSHMAAVRCFEVLYIHACYPFIFLQDRLDRILTHRALRSLFSSRFCAEVTRWRAVSADATRDCSRVCIWTRNTWTPSARISVRLCQWWRIIPRIGVLTSRLRVWAILVVI